MSVKWINSRLKPEYLISFIHPLSGAESHPRHSKDCFCNPREIKPLNKTSDDCEPVRPKVFTKPKYDRNTPKTNTNTSNHSSDK